ncbi:MAG TPA: Uma2 family endonuclease [Thermoanaerobaculia bacterium]|nr:Uma2 family endonuclease [Thermoanaerobaculia bacterium]
MAVQDRIRKLTYDDYARIPDDGKRHEIIDGEHYVTPAPSLWHQRLIVRIFRWLDSFVLQNCLGEVLFAPCDVVLSWNDVVQPDLLFISKERAAIAGKENVQGAPDLVVEILSKRTRKLDEKSKIQTYERFGVREYWIVDGFRMAVSVYRLSDGMFRLVAKLSAEAGDAVLTTPLLPGLEIPLAEIFA